jgi:hypothetical protein
MASLSKSCACGAPTSPHLPDFLSPLDHAVSKSDFLFHGRLFTVAEHRRFDSRSLQPREEWLHRAFRVSQELATADRNESPAEPLQNRLPCHVLRQPLRRMEPIPITLDRKALSLAFNHQIDLIMAHLPLRDNPITHAGEPRLDFSYQRRARIDHRLP